MRFQLAIRDVADIERLKELLHTHPLVSDTINPTARSIFESRKAVDSWWGDTEATDFPYIFIGDVKDSFGAGGFGVSPGRYELELIPMSGAHTFEQLDRIKEILESEEYIRIGRELGRLQNEA